MPRNAVQDLLAIFRTLLLAVKEFIGDGCFRYSASLSFYALFSIAPMVMISVHAASLLAADVDFQGELIRQFSALVGERGAQGIAVLLENMEDADSSRFQLIVSTAVLLFSATNMFVQLQVAFNVIYAVKVTGRGILKQILDRLVSLGIIVSLGLIMLISLVIDSAIMLMQGYLTTVFPGLAVVFVSVLQNLVLGLLAALELYALLHFLPDVHIPTRYKLSGAATVTVLLMVGKSFINWYIANSQFSELGGASASVIILMLWIYYSSLILFFGAEVIKAMAAREGIELEPKRYAARIRTVVEEDEEGGRKETSASKEAAMRL